MSVLLLVFYVVQGRILGGSALPLSLSVINDPGTLIPTCDCPDTRSIWDIIWGCLATLFACTWVAVHPNIPSPWDNLSEWRVIRRRLKLMFFSLLAPEMILLWAMRQWRGARRLAEEYKDHGWTQTEGHFLQMGGFRIVETTGQVWVLSPEKLKELQQAGRIDFPSISSQDIEDKSKGDAFAKAIAVIQTLWFIAQIIARGVQGLVVTELEIVTLAFAALNGVMYYLWWFKPLDVRSPHSIYLKEEGKRSLVEVEHLSVKHDPVVSGLAQQLDNDTSLVAPVHTPQLESVVETKPLTSLKTREEGGPLKENEPFENGNATNRIALEVQKRIIEEEATIHLDKAQTFDNIPLQVAEIHSHELEDTTPSEASKPLLHTAASNEDVASVTSENPRHSQSSPVNVGQDMDQTEDERPLHQDQSTDHPAASLESEGLQEPPFPTAENTETMEEFINRISEQFGGRRHVPLWRKILFNYMIGPFVVFIDALGSMFVENDVLESEEKMPEFYAYGVGAQDGNGVALFFAIVWIAVAFGGIHCIAWAFRFPTHTEQVLWRVSALLVTCLPLCILGLLLVYGLLRSSPMESVAAFSVSGVILLYCAARIALLVQACISLRDLSPGALASIKWTSFVPHI